MANILLTGGHGATTGIAVIEEINKRYPNSKISWIGSKCVVSGSDATSLEYKIYPTMGVKYFSINAGKLQTKFTRYTIPLLFLIPVGFIQALYLILKIKPRVVFSFGGFSSFPVVFWSWVLRIPIILHEQTTVAGRASIASAYFVNKIGLSRDVSLKYFPANKCYVTGNPIRKNILKITPKTNLGKDKTILVMGGSRGSEFINDEIVKISEILTNKYKVIHITGERDYLKYKHLTNPNYIIYGFVNPNDLIALYEKSDVIISRAGANTVSEIIYIKRPSILIPLPRTYMDEQLKNALYAEKFGIAKVILEGEVNQKSLINALEQIFDDWPKTLSKLKQKTSPDVNASQKVVDLAMEYI